MRTFDVGREILKIVAIITMTLDHVGAILYPDIIFLRIIGRIAFTLFAYLITLGIESTKKPRTYLITLFLFALVSQIPYFLAFEIQPFEQLNILFPLLLSAIALYSFNKKQTIAFFVILFLAVLSSFLLNMEGSFYTIVTVLCMKLLKNKPELGIIALVAVNLSVTPTTQIFSLLALPLIFLHVQNHLRKEILVSESSLLYLLRKYAFYLYYPLHLTLLFIVHQFFF